eukprot:scaffold15363_cov160-Isochrysis_galbana.AAC.1
MVSSSFDPFLPTAEELAGDAPASGENDDKPSERQASHSHARSTLPAQYLNTKHLLLTLHKPQSLMPSPSSGRFLRRDGFRAACTTTAWAGVF